MEKWLKKGAKGEFKHEFDQKLWTAFKKWLLKYKFHNKCAYCETAAIQFYADAEHYRPKGSVQFRDDAGELAPATCKVPVDAANPMSMTHPGYFWLAYNWRNLIPACKSCNSGLDDGQGKVDQFPISKTYVVAVRLSDAQAARLKDKYYPSTLWPRLYYLGPLDLDEREVPLILNPLNASEGNDPRKHIRFGRKGVIGGLTPEGRETIKICRLKNEQLRNLRQVAQERIHSLYYAPYADPYGAVDAAMMKQRLQPFVEGAAPHSAAALDYIKVVEEEREIIKREIFGAGAGG